MLDDIISFLDFKPNEVHLIEIKIIDSVKEIHIEKTTRNHFCPECNYRLHSKGIYKRTINHPILQDGYQVKIILHQRRWKCSNPLCSHTENDQFTFVQPNHRNTNIVPFQILKEMKDLNVSAAQIAERYSVSDTYVHNIFLQYIDCKRLPLPSVLSVDEVHLDFNDKNKYALVLLNFETGEIVDILPNRLKNTYQSYFYNIPYKERKNVTALVCDMYNPYINFAPNYFPNSSVIIDSFHVLQWINRKILNYINEVKKKYQARDREKLAEVNYENNQNYQTRKTSLEVYLLTNHQWVLLSSTSKIRYSNIAKFDKFLQTAYSTFDYEKMFLALDDHFPRIRELRQIYQDFNDSFPMEEDKAKEKLSNIIELYKNCSLAMFREYAETLEKYQKEIIQSFYIYTKIETEECETIIRRISNGPIEGFNRKPKDYKRQSRGVTNIRYSLNRIMWANRKDEPILAVPKPLNEIQTRTNIKRGHYKKKKQSD